MILQTKNSCRLFSNHIVDNVNGKIHFLWKKCDKTKKKIVQNRQILTELRPFAIWMLQILSKYVNIIICRFQVDLYNEIRNKKIKLTISKLHTPNSIQFFEKMQRYFIFWFFMIFAIQCVNNQRFTIVFYVRTCPVTVLIRVNLNVRVEFPGQ